MAPHACKVINSVLPKRNWTQNYNGKQSKGLKNHGFQCNIQVHGENMFHGSSIVVLEKHIVLLMWKLIDQFF